MVFKYLELNIICYILLFHFLSNYEVESFVPDARYAHSSVLAGNRIYFLGGEKAKQKPVNEVFYLDVSQEFNNVLSFKQWTDITVSAAIPFRSSWATASFRNVNNDPTIYLYGGYMLDLNNNNVSSTSPLHTFNLNTQQWHTPNISENTLPMQRNFKSVIDDLGKMYIFGGDSVTTTAEQMFNNMIIIDTNTLSLSFGSTKNGPSQRCAYTATLLPNGMIVYIGGYKLNVTVVNESPVVDITEIYLYDTKRDSWSLMNADNINSIESRYLHSAVLASDNKIIIYGGVKDALGAEYIKVSPDFAVLDTNTLPFEWTVPQVTSNVGNIPSLTGHSANLVGNYMVVAFGNITRPNAFTVESNSKIYLMDVRNYTWVNTFDSNNLQPNTNPNPTNNPEKKNTIKIVVGILSGVAAATMATLGYLIHRLNKKRKAILLIAGSEKENSVIL